jgi:hypothetical protein
MESRIMTDIRLSKLAGVSFGTTEDRPLNPSIGQPFYNGSLGIVEIYTAQGWVTLGGAPPDVPVDVSAVDVGTNSAFGSAVADVSFSAGGGGPSTSFIVTPSPSTSPTTFTVSSSPARVSGLTTGTTYSFTVQARNAIGTSISSAATNTIVPTTVPQAPTIGTPSNVTGVAFGSTTSASLTFTAGATGGKSITNYKYSTDGTTYTAFSPAQTTSPLTITGLTSGESYTIRLKAVNANGDSAASSASSSVTTSTVPQAPTIGTATAGNLNATVTWTAGANGNSAITGYTVTSSPGNISVNAASNATSVAVTGLTAGTSYTFTVRATNANGTSTASSASNSVTPINPFPIITEYTSSGTFTVNNGFPATVAVYALGGGGNGGGAGVVGNSNQLSFAGGGGGGGGSYSAANVTINSNLNITVGGAGAASSIGGGTSLNANGGSAGNSGSSSGNQFTAGTAGNGGSGGSGGGGGGIFVGNDNNGDAQVYQPGGAGGTAGGNGAGGGSGSSGGSGSGVSQSSSGGSGYGGTERNYGGINVGGANYFSGRGLGGGHGRGASGGAVLVIQNG